MEQNSSSHIRNGDDCHDQEGAEHEAFAPSFKDVSFGVIDISPVSEGFAVVAAVEMRIANVECGNRRCHG